MITTLNFYCNSILQARPLLLGLNSSFFFKTLFIYFQIEGKGGRKKERIINVRLPLTHPLLGIWPATQACALHWESNWPPFGSQSHAQSTESHQPGLHSSSYTRTFFIAVYTLKQPVCMKSQSQHFGYSRPSYYQKGQA